MSTDPFVIEIHEDEISIEVEHDDAISIDIEVESPIQVDFPCSVTINNYGDTTPSIISIIKSFQAGAPINTNRVVALRPDGRIVHADKDVNDHNLDVIGMSRQSGAIGQIVEVVKFGTVPGASFGPVSTNFFLGNNGLVLSSAPLTGNWLNIGIQEKVDEFFVNIRESVKQ